jgi:hypothetical protein
MQNSRPEEQVDWLKDMTIARIQELVQELTETKETPPKSKLKQPYINWAMKHLFPVRDTTQANVDAMFARCKKRCVMWLVWFSGSLSCGSCNFLVEVEALGRPVDASGDTKQADKQDDPKTDKDDQAMNVDAVANKCEECAKLPGTDCPHFSALWQGYKADEEEKEEEKKKDDQKDEEQQKKDDAEFAKEQASKFHNDKDHEEEVKKAWEHYKQTGEVNKCEKCLKSRGGSVVSHREKCDVSVSSL